MSDVQTYAQEIDKKLARMIEEVAALPEEAVRWKPAPDQWSILEVLAHVEEAVEYWCEELGRVMANPGVSWGRTLQDERRLAAVAQASRRSTKEVLQGLARVRRLAQERLSRVLDADLEITAPHVNPKFGIQSMRFLVEHFLVEHLEAHLKQIARNLQRYAETAKAGQSPS